MDRSIVYGLSAVACWSTVATAFKLGLGYIGPFELVFWSVLFATLMLVAVVWWQKRSLLEAYKKSPKRYWLAGMLNPGIYYPLLFLAYQKLPAQQAQSINYSWALMLTLMSAIFLKEKITKKDWLACLVGYFGVVVIATSGDLTSLNFQSPQGVIFALASTVLWAGYWIVSRKNNEQPVTAMALNFICGLPIVLIVMLISKAISGDMSMPGWQGLLAAVYIGLMEMALAFVLWLKALQATENTARVSNLIYLSPLISLVLINQVLGEAIHSATLIGLAMILLAVAFQQKRKAG
ncbi:DMT family transporter [Pelagibaculum spongiae]|uniref:DMT family transporter n=1 Tax=Pelagibaculum spongiae TaxID=2080658 RepID=UPI0019D48DDF|nr:DMT family transporter [Pelagibaculum spongiae]